MTLALVIWYALGIANVGFMCRFKLSYLNICQLFTYLVLAPIAECMLIMTVLGTGIAIMENPLKSLGIFLIAISSTIGGVCFIRVVEWAVDNFGNFCKIVWRKEPCKSKYEKIS